MLCEQCGKEGGRRRKGRPFSICVSCQNKLYEEIKVWQENERHRTQRAADLAEGAPVDPNWPDREILGTFDEPT